MDNNSFNLGQWFTDQLAIYQTANSDYQSVRNNFVIRTHEYEIIIDSLLSKKNNDPIQHELIIGRRGSGKSTLLKRLEVEIVENINLKEKYIAINFAEEQAGIYRLFDLWEQVIYELQTQHQLDIQLPDFNNFDDNLSYTRFLYQLINECCEANHKKIILLLDNFDRVVENFTDDGNLLREILINHNNIQIIAGSTRMDEHFWRYDMPFYNFFRVHRLEALSRAEINQLITHWGNLLNLDVLKTFSKNHFGKIENIRLLTDGLPRTIQFFIQIVLQKSEIDTYDYLKKTMDLVSPLYQERLNSLTAPLRKIVYEMAFIWEACNTKQLVNQTKMESKLISANLKTLESKGIVEKIQTNKRQHLYRLSERFFNMWIIVTQGNPEQKRKAKWLSVFLENWYDSTDFFNMTQSHLNNLKAGHFDYKQALVISKGLSQSKFISTQDRDAIIELTEKLKPKNPESLLIELPEKFENILNKIYNLIDLKKYNLAINLANEIENEADGFKFFLLGYIYHEQKKYKDSERYYILAIEKDVVEAIYNLATLYQNQQKYNLAEKYYLQAIEKGDINAMNNLANLYQNQQKYDLAEKYYLQAIEKGNIDAMYNLANLYKYQQKYDIAEKHYLQAIEKGVVEALCNLGNLYINQQKYDLAEKYYLQAIEKGDINAMYNLAILYNDQQKYDLAEKYYLQAIEKGNINAMYNLANLYLIINKNKSESLNLIKKYDELESDLLTKALLLVIEVWNGIFDDVENRLLKIIYEDFNEIHPLIFNLLVHKQKAIILNLFENTDIGQQLKEQYVVLYYVTLILNNVKDDNLLLKIPPEIHETVNDILKEIKEQQVFYGYV